MEVDKLAAGQKYNKTLNYDEHNVKTPAFHDPNLDEWLMASANVVKTESGLFVFQKGTDDGKAKVLAELSGSNVEIGGVSFAVSGGDTLRGKFADKPDAVAAHAVIPYCFYFSIDTGVVEATDGMNWVVI